MKDHEIRELVNQLRDVAIKYHGAGQLREQIARTVRASMLQAGDTVSGNSFSDLDLEGMSHGNNPQANAYRELLAYRRNSPAIPDGYVMVPKEPTAEMQSAGASAIRIETTALNKLWTGNAVFRAMLAAAPQEVNHG